jgi:hypothetical protein
VIDAAATNDLWPEALDLLNHLSSERRAEFARRTAARDGAVIDSLIASVQRHELWDSVVPLVELLTPEQQQQLAARAR